MTLRVIDVSANQGLINIAPIDCDAVIVKGTGGDNYVNDCSISYYNNVLS